MSNADLVQKLINDRRLKTPTIIKAFKKIDRADFVGQKNQDYAYFDEALPIGHGQTISQPTTVAIMLELLQPKSGDKVLDIGFGSGWTTALLAEIVGPKGKVYAIEIIKEIFEFGEANLKKLHLRNVVSIHGDGSKGLPEKAPFDHILASAAAGQIPQTLKEQLVIGGILVLPVGESIFRLVKKYESEFETEEYPFFAFVPMRGRYGQNKI